MATLLYHPAGNRSARLLAAFMGIAALPHRRAGRFAGGPLLRWGSAAAVPTPPEVEVNLRSALTRYTNRLGQLRLLREGGVRVPDFQAGDRNYPGNLHENENGAVLARDFLTGRQNSHGRGITVYPAGEGYAAGHDMYMALIPKARQFRVHVIRTDIGAFAPDTHVTRTRELIPNTPEQREQPIWNLGTGFTYRQVAGQRPRGVIPAAVAAVSALGLTFGAVDVIVDPEGEVYVLEVNTAPGLAPLTLRWYATNLAPMVGLSADELPGLEAA